MKAITLRVPDEMYERLERLAKARRWSLNVFLNWLLDQVITQVEASEKGNGE